MGKNRCAKFGIERLEIAEDYNKTKLALAQHLDDNNNATYS